MKVKKLFFVALIAFAALVVPVLAQDQNGSATPTVEDLQATVSFMVIFVGVLARAFLPYLRKWLADEPIGGFQKRYIAIVIASFVTAWLAYPQFTEAFTGWWQILTAAFIFGFGLQSAYTEIYSWFESAVTKELSQQPTTSTTTPPPS